MWCKSKANKYFTFDCLNKVHSIVNDLKIKDLKINSISWRFQYCYNDFNPFTNYTFIILISFFLMSENVPETFPNPSGISATSRKFPESLWNFLIFLKFPEELWNFRKCSKICASRRCKVTWSACVMFSLVSSKPISGSNQFGFKTQSNVVKKPVHVHIKTEINHN